SPQSTVTGSCRGSGAPRTRCPLDGIAIRQVQYRSFGIYRTPLVQGGSRMNWYDEAARHQSELRQEAANERAIPRTGSITVVLDWFRRLFNDHHAPQPLVESRGRDVA